MGVDSNRALLAKAVVLALGAAVSLGLARFSYALLLPPMRADLGWSYFTAGFMNTVNAAGYLVGALASPWLMRRFGARAALLAGSGTAAVLLMLHGMARTEWRLSVLRFATGVASAAVFVSGGLLAARLASQVVTEGEASAAQRAGRRQSPGLSSSLSPGLLLGIYYGGTGLGIVASALLVPGITALGVVAGTSAVWPEWRWAWLGLGALALAATGVMALRVPVDVPPLVAAHANAAARFRWRPLGFGLAGYFMFGLGYIGYMTFIVTLLREQQLSTATIVAFYSLLGLGVMVSPWLWARLLQRQRGGVALGLLNAQLGLAVLLPVLWAHPAVAFASGAWFGGVFLSVVASTTALVRHNLPPALWPAGISAFTVVFAAGQIVGPTLVGALSDASGGLRLGLGVSAALLLLGAVLAAVQKPVPDFRSNLP